MSGYNLKLIAIITMVIDHITAVLVAPSHPFYIIGRSIGRLSFPIFCFLMVQGHKHTSNIKKYLLRLLAFSLISEIPFDFAFYNPLVSNSYLYHQNIFFTLFIGLLVITLLDRVDKMNYIAKSSKERANINSSPYGAYLSKENFLKAAILIGGCLSAVFLHTDYSYVGVLMIWALYKFENNRQNLFISLFIINLIYGFPQILAVFSLFIINMYNGQKGKQVNKYMFYGFYPFHLIVLYLINLLII